jgi:hypothetical protein
MRVPRKAVLLLKESNGRFLVHPAGVGRPRLQAHDPTIQRKVCVYQKTLYYLFKNLVGLFWYIVQGMARPDLKTV